MKTFYDIHMHAFDLSHPNLSVFFQRDDLIDDLIDKVLTLSTRLTLPFINFFPNSCIKKEINKKIAGFQQQLNNTLAFFEIPMEYQFLVLDYFLRKNVSANNQPLQIGEDVYDKMVLCPLVIDFGRKNIQESTFYNLTPKTPTASQVSDLLYAIRTYCRFNVETVNNKMSLEEINDWADCKQKKLFEIYPFMGIDTQNYDTKEDVKNLLDKYFKGFSRNETAEERRGRLFEKMGMFDGNLYRDRQILTADDKAYLTKKHIALDYQYAFAGIKVYPQLGFNPFPDNPDELDKVKVLYEYCVEKRIPITTHCSDSGYKPEDNNHLTSPLEKWTKVLNAYPGLTLNFAHFGSQTDRKKTQWRDAIIELTNKYDRVFTDIACKKPAYYAELRDLTGANPRLREKVLFGSDFSINLLVTKTNCYNENLEAFTKAEFDTSCKMKICESNPQRFLFGE